MNKTLIVFARYWTKTLSYSPWEIARYGAGYLVIDSMGKRLMFESETESIELVNESSNSATSLRGFALLGDFIWQMLEFLICYYTFSLKATNWR